MRRGVAFLSLATLAVALALASLTCLAAEHRYVEDFTTTGFRDAANTTAWWDTVSAQLQLTRLTPTIVGNYNTSGYAYGVAVAGDHAFVADYGTGLRVIDILNLTSPALVGTYNTPGTAWGVAVAGDLALVADGAYGLQLVDVSNRASPTLAGAYDTPGFAYEVAVAGTLAFVADGATGLLVIDVGDPASPVLVGSYDTSGSANGVAVWGAHAFLADGTAGLQVLDVSDPAHPVRVGGCDTSGSASGIAVWGECAFVADNAAGLQVIDVSDRANPAVVGTYNTTGTAYKVAVDGVHAFVADGTAGLQMIDVSDPAHPTRVTGRDTAGNSRGVAVAGGHAFVADYDAGLQVIETGEIMTPRLLGNVDTPDYATKVAVWGSLAVVSGGSSGLQLIDFADPAHPVLVGSSDLLDWAYEAAISGHHAFVADPSVGLQVLDISDPAAPTIVGSCTTGVATGVAVSGDIAVVADYTPGIKVIDISDPAAPTVVGTCATTGDAVAVAISGRYAFVGESLSTNFQVIDIGDPALPVVIGTLATSDAVFDVAVAGQLAFLAVGSVGLQVVDINDPAAPALVGTYNTLGNARGVAVAGNYAFVADYNWGLQVIDVTNPATPVLVGNLDTSGLAYGVAVAGDLVLMADHNLGVQVIHAFQSVFDWSHNVGRSLAVDATSDPILRARLTAAQEGSINWRLSANGGGSWQTVSPDGSWNLLAISGADLRWRADLLWGADPGVTGIELDWLVDKAVVDSIADVPGDQGGWARAHFTRSGRDFADEAALPIVNYGVWRRVDAAALPSAVAAGPVSAGAAGMVGAAAVGPASAGSVEAVAAVTAAVGAAPAAPAITGLPLVTRDDRVFVPAAAAAAASFPPGTWELVANVPALQQEAYVALVPTAADSSASGPNPVVLVVTAHTTTPAVWYASAPDSGWSVDNLAPHVPDGFAVAYGAGGNALSWEACPDADFEYFRVYRGSTPDFVPALANLAHATVETAWVDPEPGCWGCYYKITALDHAGNESAAASPGTVTGLDDGSGSGGPGRDGAAVPARFALLGAAPNPFNPQTTIACALPRPERLRLAIYDLSGRAVRRLVDEVRPAGVQAVRWDGKDDHGLKVASGVYVCRMVAGPHREAKRLTLVQ